MQRPPCHECQRLTAAGRPDLASRVVHVALTEGDSAGYDIRSFDLSGSERFIEVKTTRGPATTAFFVSPNQVATSERHPGEFVLARLFNYSDQPGAASYYELPGALTEHLDLEPSEFRAMLKPGSGPDAP